LKRKGLPKEWQRRTLGDVGEYINGKAFKPSEWGETGRPIVRIQNLTETSKDFNYYDGEVDPKYLIKNGDVLISWSASLGVFLWNGGEAVLNQHIFKAIPNEKIVTREFFTYALRVVIEDMKRYTHGSTMKHIVKSDFDNTVIPIPPLDTQRKIVAILDKAEATQRLRAEADALMQDLTQSAFQEMFGDPVRNTKRWPRAKLEDLSLEIVDCPHSTPKYNESFAPYPCIRTTDLRDGFIDWSVMKYVGEREYKERVGRLVPTEGDIVYSREGSFGVAVRVPKDVNMCLGQRTMLFRPNLDVCTSEFLWALINSKGLYQQALKKTSGSTVGHINVKDVKQFVGFHPPLHLQAAFTDIVKEIEKMMSYQKSSDRSISVLLESINAKAFTGELVP
jgi:type I restriction enzyme S subunit